MKTLCTICLVLALLFVVAPVTADTTISAGDHPTVEVSAVLDQSTGVESMALTKRAVWAGNHDFSEAFFTVTSQDNLSGGADTNFYQAIGGKIGHDLRRSTWTGDLGFWQRE